MENEFSHRPVLLAECIEGLAIKKTVFMWMGPPAAAGIPLRSAFG